MLVLDISPAAAPVRTAVLGSCRLHDPLALVAEAGEASLVWRDYVRFTHTPEQAEQYLRLLKGEATLPPEFEPFVFYDEGPAATVHDSAKVAFANAEVLVVEVCTNKAAMLGPWVVQNDYFFAWFAKDEAIGAWQYAVTSGQPESVVAPLRQAARTSLRRLGRLDAFTEQVLASLTGKRHDAASFARGLRALQQLGPRLLVVPHFLTGEATEEMHGRASTRSMVMEASAAVGAAVFDPTPLARAHDGLADAYHYRDEFRLVLGREIAAEVEALVGRRRHG